MRLPFFFFICSLTFYGCAGQGTIPQTAMKGGEWINIEYTCRTPSGELAATSLSDVAEDASIAHSPLFSTLNNYLPAIETVPLPQEEAKPLAKTMCFEEMVELLLARQALGASINTTHHIVLDGELIPGISGGDRYLTMNLAYLTDRKKTVPLAEFKESFKSVPVPGKRYDSEIAGLTAVVNALEGENVIMTYDAASGTFLPSPFGNEMITQIGDNLEFRTDTKTGLLVRSGPAIGNVTEVNDSTFVIDYGHSFGFTPLTCETVFRPYTSPDGQNWYNNLNIAAEESKKSGKLMLVHFHDQWSGPSRSFLTKILPDPKVIAATRGYIRVQINTVNRLSLLQKYEVTTFPSVLVMDSQTRILKKYSGLPDVNQFANGLQKILAGPVPFEK